MDIIFTVFTCTGNSTGGEKLGGGGEGGGRAKNRTRDIDRTEYTYQKCNG